MSERFRNLVNAARRMIGLDPDQAAALDANTGLNAGNPVASQSDLPSNPLDFKGEIAVAADFPTAAAVQVGWWYSITAPVTDNDATKTNTGLSFVAGDEIYWSGSTYGTVGPLLTNKADKVTGAVAGNFSGLDGTGNLTDSGSKAADFATAAHKTQHQNGGGDELALDGSQITTGTVTTPRLSTGATASDVCIGNDSRLSDARAPTAHAADHGNGQPDAVSLDGAQITAGTVTTTRLSTGATVNDVCIGNDSRLSDARTPTAHAASHTTGADQISLATTTVKGLEAPADKAAFDESNALEMGFTTAPTLSWNDGNRRLTLTGTHVYVRNGLLVSKAATTIDITDADGTHYIYYNASDVLTDSLTIWNFATEVPVATVYWNVADGTATLVGYEAHTNGINYSDHGYKHLALGALHKEGNDLSGYTLNLDTDVAVQFGVSAGGYFDEDLEHDVEHAASPAARGEQFINDPAKIIKLYRDGSGNWSQEAATNFPFPYGTYAQYNEDQGGGTWALTDVTNSYYSVFYIVFINDLRHSRSLVCIPGQTQYQSRSLAADAAYSDLDWGNLNPLEFRPIAKLVVRSRSAYGETTQSRIFSVTDIRRVQNSPGLPASNIVIPTEFLDSAFRVIDDSDTTKKIAFEASGITTGTTRTITMSDADVLLTGGSDGDVLTVQADGSYAPETPSSGQVTYDVIVDAAGGDYTLPSTAFDTEGANKTYLIKRGTYTESASVTIPAGAVVHWDHVILDFATTEFLANWTEDNALSTGVLTITGEGATEFSNLLKITGSGGEFGGLRVTIEYELKAAATGIYVVTLGGDDNTNPLVVFKDFAETKNVTMVCIVLDGLTHSRVKAIVQNMSLSTTTILHAMFAAGNSLYNTIDIIAEGLANPGAGNATGVRVLAGTNYNTFYGVVRNCKTASTDDGGTGTNLAALIV